MPTTWAELLDLGDREVAPRRRRRGASERRRAARLPPAASREPRDESRQALGAELSASLFETVDAETWERLEEALIMADVGARTTAEVVGRLEGEVEAGKVEGADGDPATASSSCSPSSPRAAGRRSTCGRRAPRSC